MRYCLTIALATLVPAAGGCNWLAWWGYVLNPKPPMKSVQPEFRGLSGKQLAIVVYAGPEIQLDFETIQLELSDAISAKMNKHIKDIELVDPRQVIRYQDEDPRWNAIPPEKLCTVFGCDYVLLVSLIEFSTREPGSVHLARGRLTAEAKLYRSPAGGRGGCVWRARRPFRVVHPAESPMGIPTQSDWDIRIKTEQIFAEALTKKFYKHKVPIEP